MPLDTTTYDRPWLADVETGVESLTPDEREMALHYLTWLRDFWGGDEQRWFQGPSVARGRRPGDFVGKSFAGVHCLLTPQFLEKSTGWPYALRALGFTEAAAIHWNNDSETTFAMVNRRVCDAIATLEGRERG